jgi:hypothetical protein
MDVVGAVGRKLGVVAGAPPETIGRWFGYLLRGRVTHEDIALAPPLPMELPLAGLGHYMIGAALGVGFLLVVRRASVAGSVLATALVYGAVTSVFAWLLMFPAMGYGWFGLRGPQSARLLRTSVINHLAYGLGLGLWAMLF